MPAKKDNDALLRVSAIIASVIVIFIAAVFMLPDRFVWISLGFLTVLATGGDLSNITGIFGGKK